MSPEKSPHNVESDPQSGVVKIAGEEVTTTADLTTPLDIDDAHLYRHGTNEKGERQLWVIRGNGLLADGKTEVEIVETPHGLNLLSVPVLKQPTNIESNTEASAESVREPSQGIERPRKFGLRSILSALNLVSKKPEEHTSDKPNPSLKTVYIIDPDGTPVRGVSINIHDESDKE